MKGQVAYDMYMSAACSLQWCRLPLLPAEPSQRGGEGGEQREEEKEGSRERSAVWGAPFRLTAKRCEEASVLVAYVA